MWTRICRLTIMWMCLFFSNDIIITEQYICRSNFCSVFKWQGDLGIGLLDSHTFPTHYCFQFAILSTCTNIWFQSFFWLRPKKNKSHIDIHINGVVFIYYNVFTALAHIYGFTLLVAFMGMSNNMNLPFIVVGILIGCWSLFVWALHDLKRDSYRLDY